MKTNDDRCIHCGWPKKDHRRPGLKCMTRLHDTRWHGWRDGECTCGWCTRGLYKALDGMLRDREARTK